MESFQNVQGNVTRRFIDNGETAIKGVRASRTVGMVSGNLGTSFFMFENTFVEVSGCLTNVRATRIDLANEFIDDTGTE